MLSSSGVSSTEAQPVVHRSYPQPCYQGAFLRRKYRLSSLAAENNEEGVENAEENGWLQSETTMLSSRCLAPSLSHRFSFPSSGRPSPHKQDQLLDGLHASTSAARTRSLRDAPMTAVFNPGQAPLAEFRNAPNSNAFPQNRFHSVYNGDSGCGGQRRH